MTNVSDLQSKRKTKSLRARRLDERAENIHCALSCDTLSPLHDMTPKPYMEQENRDEVRL